MTILFRQCASVGPQGDIEVILEIKWSNLLIGRTDDTHLSMSDGHHKSDVFELQFDSKFDCNVFEAMLTQARKEACDTTLRQSEALAAVVKKGVVAKKRRENKVVDDDVYTDL